MASSLHLLSYSVWFNPPSHFSDWAKGSRVRYRSPSMRNGWVKEGRRGETNVPTSRADPIVFQNLEADDFQHPLDKQLSDLYQLLVEASKVLNIEPPDLYLRQNPFPNAYTLAISGKKPFIVVHTSLVELLSRNELQAVLAHELGHLKCDHGVWLTFANILTLGAYSVPGLGGIIAQRLEEQLLRWLRAAELTCDRAALLVAQDPKVVIFVLMKLAGGSPSLSNQLNVDAFLEQARSYDKASSSPFGWYIKLVSSFHPLLQSDPFKCLLVVEMLKQASYPILCLFSVLVK